MIDPKINENAYSLINPAIKGDFNSGSQIAQQHNEWAVILNEAERSEGSISNSNNTLWILRCAQADIDLVWVGHREGSPADAFRKGLPAWVYMEISTKSVAP
ncbi:MAG: hypothetical protein HGB02_08240 [Chlorobiaceae bacterium]|nr:hypothetical protein [Chlorobiaceae bacterium]